MFEKLFKRPAALARYRAGPLLEERLRYLTFRADQGMVLTTLQLTAHYLLVIARCLRLADRPGEVITRDEIERMALRWPSLFSSRALVGSQRTRKLFLCHATAWLRFLGRLQPPPPPPRPFAQELDAFADYLRREKGLAAGTISGHCSFLHPFLGHLLPSGGSLQDVTIGQIDDAFASHLVAAGYSRVTVRGRAASLRAFFLFAQRQGWCRAGLAAAIRAPRAYAHETVPAGPSWDQVRQALASTQGDRPVDVRDHALLLLVAVYGLRAGEVVRLRLDDFDWERELLTVTFTKSGRPRVYPLARSVGAAVLRYLKEARPRTALRELFLSRTAPRRRMHRTTVYLIVSRRLRVVNPHLARFGPHSLRHACATHLLEQGLSLKEIGDHLGHLRPDTTRLYAKVDLAGLRQVADVELGGLL